MPALRYCCVLRAQDRRVYHFSCEEIEDIDAWETAINRVMSVAFQEDV